MFEVLLIKILPSALIKLDAVILPTLMSGVTVTAELLTRNRLLPFTCKSSRLPVNPDAELTPSPVPFVLHPVEVAPVGSIKSCGFVVVAVPPVNHVPVIVAGGVDAAPLSEEMSCPESVSAEAEIVPVSVGDALSTALPVPVTAYSPTTPALLYKTRVFVPLVIVVVPTVIPDEPPDKFTHDPPMRP